MIFVFVSFHLPNVSPRCLFVSSAKHAETAPLYTKLTSDKRSLFPALAPLINNGNNDFVGFLLPSGIFSDRLGVYAPTRTTFPPFSPPWPESIRKIFIPNQSMQMVHDRRTF